MKGRVMDSLFVSQNTAPLIACISGAPCWMIVVYSKYIKKNKQQRETQETDMVTHDEVFHVVVNISLYVLGLTIIGLAITLKVRGYFTADLGLLVTLSLLGLTHLWFKNNNDE